MLATAVQWPTSRVRLYQTGTIPKNMQKLATANYHLYGCAQVGHFIVEPGYVNVWCLDMLVGE
jgi:hypothetical protein